MTVTRSRIPVLIVILVLGALGAGCSSGPSGGQEVRAERADLSVQASVADIGRSLDARGIDCPLEYEGLVDATSERSQCTIRGGQAMVTIWFDDAALDRLLHPPDGRPPADVAFGRNWTVELTDGEVAHAVADALGGTTTGS